MSAGNNIRKLRELRNFTQSYMAKELNLSLSGYSKIERDGTDVSIKRLEQIANITIKTLTHILNIHNYTIEDFFKLSIDEKQNKNKTNNE